MGTSYFQHQDAPQEDRLRRKSKLQKNFHNIIEYIEF